ncbi:MAG: carbamoyltransferase C-terminal domain-containing protein [Bacteroidia bacterium]
MGAIIGVNCSGFNSSACLILDGKLQYAINEERLTRIKKDKSFPLQSIKYCCKAAGISLSDVSDIFIGWHPRYYIKSPDHTLFEAMRNRGKIAYLALNELASLETKEILDVKQIIISENIRWNVHFVDHHQAHLANAYFFSEFDDCDFLVADGFGEVASGISGQVKNGKFEILHTNRTPHSLGLFYQAFTDFMGFQPNGDEWKVMALSALGDSAKYYDRINKLINIDGLLYELDLRYFEHFLFFTPRYFSYKLEELLGPCYTKGQELDQRAYDIVAAVQKVAQDVIFQLLKNLHEKTGNTKLVASGGFFMNSVLNGKIVDNTPYEELHLGGSPDDSGISVGSALYGSRFVLNKPVDVGNNRHNYYGREYTNDEVELELIKRKIRYTKLDDASVKGAELILDGKILAWFQGGSEFGQRALGNRSIIADPTRPDMKDLVNATIKYREGFRPFAPAILAEKQEKYFEYSNDQTSYFMERVFQFKEKVKDRLPAVVHYDGSGRLQTVTEELNSRYYHLIRNFAARSNVPIVLNTSFNVNGMPLVETPGDAINCFYQSGLDCLIMNDFLVEK